MSVRSKITLPRGGSRVTGSRRASPSTPACCGPQPAYVPLAFSDRAKLQFQRKHRTMQGCIYQRLTRFPIRSTVMVRIKASKTDPFRVGVTAYLGRTDQELCPVAAVLDYIARRGTCAGPLFIYENGQPLTRNSLVREVRSALLANATPYSGHSFRIGAVMSAAAAGVEDAIIKILGRWQSTAYQ